jgi:membrane protease YdiL (CAAX protease family)
VDWPAWAAPAALVAALLGATVAGAIVDVPAALLGSVKLSSSKLPGWLELLDTLVQDGVFVATALVFASLGGRAVRAWQLGLRPAPLRRSAVLVVATYLATFAVTVLWAALLGVSTKEKLLEQLGANEATTLLLLSAALTCVVAPVSEEILFRGFIFSALRKWRGPWIAAVLDGIMFGAVHVASAPAADLVPLAVLGFALCLLYRATGSLYPCIAMHSLNNSIAFGVLEGWSWQIPILVVCSLAVLTLLALVQRRIDPSTGPPGPPRAPAVATAS